MFLIAISKYNKTTENASLKISVMVWYFIIAILLTPALSTENRSDKESDSISNLECHYNFTEYGKNSLQFKPQCNNYYINIDFEDKISIINLTLSIQEIKGETNLTVSEEYSGEEFTIKIDIYETSVHTNGQTEDILQEEWEENQNHMPIHRNYLSRTPSISLIISSTENWTSYYDVTFSFDEIQHSLRIVDNYSTEGEIEDEYLPNSVRFYRLIAEPNKKWEGIKITVEYLNISKEVGEYLLIGEGTDIFKSKDYLPLYVTHIMQNSTFYIGNSSAYVAFISGPVQKEDNWIKISWGREEHIQPPSQIKEDPLGVLNSSLICFNNYSAAIQEFDKEENERFKSFRQKFAEVVKVHRQDRNIDSLDETSVILFGRPTKVQIDAIDALSILLKIVYEGKSIFTWNELQEIITKFEESDMKVTEDTEVLEYKVRKCPKENEDLPYTNDWSYLIYTMAPLFGFFALMIWAWKQNIFSQKCTPEKEGKLCSAPSAVAEPKPYEMTIPKVCLYDGDCRRGTLIQGSSQMETDERDEAEMYIISSTSQESDTLTRYLTSRRSRHRPSIQSLIEKNDEECEQSNNDKSKHMGTESEHLYDSVSSNKEMEETQL